MRYQASITVYFDYVDVRPVLPRPERQASRPTPVVRPLKQSSLPDFFIPPPPPYGTLRWFDKYCGRPTPGTPHLVDPYLPLNNNSPLEFSAADLHNARIHCRGPTGRPGVVGHSVFRTVPRSIRGRAIPDSGNRGIFWGNVSELMDLGRERGNGCTCPPAWIIHPARIIDKINPEHGSRLNLPGDFRLRIMPQPGLQRINPFRDHPIKERINRKISKGFRQRRD
ncbi:hypothetical protein DFH07DRAFT_767654 [Mycena maculata]|uniref:Uncharacterized protein n=1 Tax=Mycena maculata TaxID=230809 RepID=A0AAD7NTC3_9AGAR|nr:hypothetical protein DFH07DRAFT_767654 [Mycena maculata]